MNWMKKNLKQYKVIISGGGTGGHIYPAIAIAQALMRLDDQLEILFVGAEGKMEMEKVPAAGFQIIGLPVSGLERKLSVRNLSFIFKLLSSMKKAKKILNEFKPDAVIGVGGYASGPVLRMANRKKIPTLIQEQNSYAGITNRLLAKRTDKICVAYRGMEKYFPADKIILTGNPVRKELISVDNKKKEGCDFFQLDKSNPVILILGGSLGAKTINESVWQNLEKIAGTNTQFIWQTGSIYFQEAMRHMEGYRANNIKVLEFITRMDLAYASADLVVSRAGAGTISELTVVSKPAVLVPSPNVAEDHQTKNALALVKNEAALMIKNIEARDLLIPAALKLVQNDQEMQKLSQNISRLAIHNSAETIASEVMNLLN